jgi:hypothetical protein
MKARLPMILGGTAGVVLTLAMSSYAVVRVRDAGAAPATVDSTMGVFEGRTPCGPTAVEFTGFPSRNCEKIKWRLTLYRDPSSRRPTTFSYEGTRTTKRGSWTIRQGTPSDPNARVFHLAPAPSDKTLSLLSVEENVLLLLDPELRVLAGDASWSYALNRTDARSAP